jgi:hypothetical protein
MSPAGTAASAAQIPASFMFGAVSGPSATGVALGDAFFDRTSKSPHNPIKTMSA